LGSVRRPSNALLFTLFSGERFFLRYLSFPFGVSAFSQWPEKVKAGLAPKFATHLYPPFLVIAKIVKHEIVRNLEKSLKRKTFGVLRVYLRSELARHRRISGKIALWAHYRLSDPKSKS
jgi:hypothetical protein